MDTRSRNQDLANESQTEHLQNKSYVKISKLTVLRKLSKSLEAYLHMR